MHIFFSLTILTALNMKDDMKMTNIYGVKKPFSQGTAVTILVIGWVCYFLAWGFNIIYYVIHPSGVKIRGLRSKMYFYFCGTKHNCCCHPDADNSSESNGGQHVSSQSKDQQRSEV